MLLEDVLARAPLDVGLEGVVEGAMVLLPGKGPDPARAYEEDEAAEAVGQGDVVAEALDREVEAAEASRSPGAAGSA